MKSQCVVRSERSSLGTFELRGQAGESSSGANLECGSRFGFYAQVSVDWQLALRYTKDELPVRRLQRSMARFLSCNDPTGKEVGTNEQPTRADNG